MSGEDFFFGVVIILLLLGVALVFFMLGVMHGIRKADRALAAQSPTKPRRPPAV